MRPERAVARVVLDGFVVGLAFMISKRQLLTCAHVVNAALGRGNREAAEPPRDAKLTIQFPRARKRRGHTPERYCRVVRWGPSVLDRPTNAGFDEVDIAVLEILDVGAEGVPILRPAIVRRAGARVQLLVRVLGSPDEIHVTGRLVGLTDGGRLQMSVKDCIKVVGQ